MPHEPLLSFLRSSYAVLNLPFPELSNEFLEGMADMVVIRSKENLRLEDSKPVGSQDGSVPVWSDLIRAIDPIVVDLLNTVTVYQIHPGNRWLQVSPSSTSVQPARRDLVMGQRPPLTVTKVECLFRTNWNKKCPLGVSNVMHAREFITPEKFAESVTGGDETLVDALWELRQNCDGLGCYVDKYLGSVCPVSHELMDTISSLTPMDVLRNFDVVACATPPKKVVRVISLIMNRIIPTAILQLADYSDLTGRYITKLSRYDWIELPNRTTAFVFRKVIIPLISYLFYATDVSVGDTDILYFRRPVWDLVTTKASLALVDLLGLQPSMDTASGAKVRWTPKKIGMRPIVVQPAFVKDKTRKLLLYLNAIVKTASLGHSVLTRADSHEKLKRFVEIKDDGRPLYYLSADIQNCFESIPFGPLAEALTSMAPDATKFSSVMVSCGRLNGTPSRKRALVFKSNDISNLVAQVPASADPDNPTIVTIHKETLAEERLVWRSVQSEIFRVLTNSTYRLSTGGSTTCVNKFKVTDRGLPQGLSLSVMLVSIYYAWVDKRISLPVEKFVMVRLVDDMMCLCRCDEVLRNLFDFIVEKQSYGGINASKLSFGKFGNSEHSSLAWAGLQLEPKNNKLNVRTDKQRGRGSLRRFPNMALFFKNFLGRSLAQNALPMLFCPVINSKMCMHENAFRIGIMAAVKLEMYLRDASPSEKEMDRFMTKLDQFMKRRFLNHPHTRTLIKQFRFGFEKVLRQ